MAERPLSPGRTLGYLTVFQIMMAVQCIPGREVQQVVMIAGAFAILMAAMWVTYLIYRSMKRTAFEVETIAFFLCTLSFAVAAAYDPSNLLTQTICVIAGIVVFLVLSVLLRDLKSTVSLRWPVAIFTCLLLIFNVLFGSQLFGARNWIHIGPIGFQPSEFVKIAFIFTGAATLDRLFRKRNLGLFILLTGVCLACLAYMSDFGTAAIFFVTFLVIAYLRSGDWATLALICGGGVFAVLTMLSLKPYILQRFATWGHAWQNASVGSGYQQTRTMSAAASGGLVGWAPARAGSTPWARGTPTWYSGMLCEEWGLIIALLAVLSILTLAVFAVRACRAGRSSFYVIAACAATSMMVFQTCLNVFGAVDILPLTGVTFPFVSNGGTAMIASWGLLAFLKATDTRQNASFAIRLPSRREDRRGAALAPKSTDEWEADDEED